MEALHFLIDAVLHLDHHLVELVVRFDGWIYLLLFLVIFAETGLVVTPFLPGDSLLFGVGALAAVDATHTLRILLLLPLLGCAAILGNTTNYHIGRYLGRTAESRFHRFFKAAHLERAQQFFARHGALAVVLSRFMPILRTFMPFAAGIGRMHIGRFQMCNIAGGVAWVTVFLGGGYLFGNLPVVKANFGLVTLGIIAVSLLPLLIVALQDWRERRRMQKESGHRG